MGELKNLSPSTGKPALSIDTYAGKVEVVFDEATDCTPLGQLPFFIDFIKTSGVYDALLQDCPLGYMRGSREAVATRRRSPASRRCCTAWGG